MDVELEDMQIAWGVHARTGSLPGHVGGDATLDGPNAYVTG